MWAALVTILELVQPAGVPIGHLAVATTYCEATQQAIVLDSNGELVAIESSGASKKLGSVGSIGRTAMACDGSGRVIVARRADLAVVENGTVTLEPATLGMVATARKLDDGAVAFVSQNGTVTRWDGAQIDSWKFTPPKFLDRPALTSDGQRVVTVAAGMVNVYDVNGLTIGPRVSAATWAPDNKSLFAVSPTQGLFRWRVGDAPERITVLDPNVHAIDLYVAGNRIVASLLGEASIIELDARGTPTGPTLASSRWPRSFPRVAVGSGNTGLVVEGDRGYILDLAVGGPLIDEKHPSSTTRAMAWSPDGKALALAGTGDEMLLVDTSTGDVIERLAKKLLFAQTIRWQKDGTIIVRGGPTITKFNKDHTITEEKTTDVAGIDANGAPIVPKCIGTPLSLMMADASATHIAARCAGGLALEDRKTGKQIAYESSARPMAFAVAGAKVFYVLGNDVHVLDAHGDKLLAKLPVNGPLIHLVASPDRKHIAIASSHGELSIWNTSTLKPVLDEPAHRDIMTAIAWSPDGKKLAVASAYSIDIWTLPRLK